MLVTRSLGSVKLISIDREEMFKVLNETAIKIKEENSEVIDIRLFGSITKKGRQEKAMLIS